jgi:hypothetical protein
MARPNSEVRRLRKFAMYVYGQLGTGARTNGIDQAFCAKIGLMAKEALRIPHVCVTTSGDEQVTCDDPECPKKLKKGKR